MILSVRSHFKGYFGYLDYLNGDLLVLSRISRATRDSQLMFGGTSWHGYVQGLARLIPFTDPMKVTRVTRVIRVI